MIFKFKTLYGLILLTVLLFPILTWSKVTYRDYINIKKVARTLQKRYPASEYIYVGLGASPVGIMAYLELTLGQQQILHLPMSHVSGLHFDKEKTQSLTPEIERTLNRHFSLFLPESTIAHKKILLIDYSLTGGSLAFTRDQISSYLNRFQIPSNVTSVALNSNLRDNPEILEAGHDVLIISRYFHRRLLSQHFDLYRKHEPFHLRKFLNHREYSPPKERLEDWNQEDFLELLRKDYFASTTYEHLLFELQRLRTQDPTERVFYDNLMSTHRSSNMIFCRNLF